MASERTNENLEGGDVTVDGCGVDLENGDSMNSAGSEDYEPSSDKMDIGDMSETTDGCGGVPEPSSGASGSAGSDAISGIDRLLMNHRSEHRPENVMMEVSDLVDRRPVSSLLASLQFRRNLESALHGALSSMQLRHPSPSRTDIGEGGHSGRVRSAMSEHVGLAARSRPRAVSPPLDLGTWRAAGERGHTRRDQRRNPPTVTWADVLNDTEAPPSDSARPNQIDGSGSGGGSPVDVVASEQTSFLSSAALAFNRSEAPTSSGNNSRMQLAIQDALQQARRDELVADISELVQRELVSSTLTGAFRGSLERLMVNHLHNTHTDGQRVAQFIRSLPAIRPPRNDFSHLGIGAADGAGSDDLDQLSVISATAAAAAATATAHHTQVSPALSGELVAIRSQIQEMKGLIRMIFEAQLDTQRAIRQEVAAAMNQALCGSHDGTGCCSETASSSMPVPAAATPYTNGKCAVCLDDDVDTVLYQCGHMCVCYSCGMRLKEGDALCPLCRAPIRDIIRAYRKSS